MSKFFNVFKQFFFAPLHISKIRATTHVTNLYPTHVSCFCGWQWKVINRHGRDVRNHWWGQLHVNILTPHEIIEYFTNFMLHFMVTPFLFGVAPHPIIFDPTPMKTFDSCTNFKDESARCVAYVSRQIWSRCTTLTNEFVPDSFATTTSIISNRIC